MRDPWERGALAHGPCGMTDPGGREGTPSVIFFHHAWKKMRVHLRFGMTALSLSVFGLILLLAGSAAAASAIQWKEADNGLHVAEFQSV